MTFLGRVSPESRESVENRVKEVLSEQLNNLEIVAQYESSDLSWNSPIPLTQRDLYKLVSIMNYDEKTAIVNENPASKLILGGIETVSEDNPVLFTLGKTCYCRESVGSQITLAEGSLITADAKYPSYATLQADDLYRASTIGKVVCLGDRYIYIDVEGNHRSRGEFDLSKLKKLELNTDPTLVRKQSLSAVSTPKQLTGRTFTGLQRRPSGTNLSARSLSSVPESPRTIHRFRLVRYI